MVVVKSKSRFAQTRLEKSPHAAVAFKSSARVVSRWPARVDLIIAVITQSLARWLEGRHYSPWLHLVVENMI